MRIAVPPDCRPQIKKRWERTLDEMPSLPAHDQKFQDLVCTGKPGQTGYPLEQAAEILLRAGAWNVLLINDGADVLQRIRSANGRMEDMVVRPPSRNRLHSTFIFARSMGTAEKKGEDQDASA